MSQSISIIEPVHRAIDTTRQILFAPFDMVKWLGLGFTAWLTLLSGNTLMANSSNVISRLWQGVKEWAMAHLALVISLLIPVGLVVVAVALVVSWISSRGAFMFLDNVVRDRADIAEPWQRNRVQGNSYFLFSIGYGLAALAMLGVILLIGVLIAMPDITRHQFGANAVAAIILGGLLFGLYMITLICVQIFLEDFIAPLMFLRSCRALTAWSEFFDLFKAHTGPFILYVLFKIALGMALGAISLIACCCLCCVMWIPYISTVILLPLLVFLRCYSLHFLEQFGGPYRIFQQDAMDYLAVGHEPALNV